MYRHRSAGRSSSAPRRRLSLLFSRPFRLRWCFDVEVLARLMGMQARGEIDVARQCVELPLEVWEDTSGSKLGLRQVPQILGELIRLRGIVAAERSGGCR